MRQYKIIVEKHPDGYVAYPSGFNGVVVGQGDTYEEAFADVESPIRFHIETFREDAIECGVRIVSICFRGECKRNIEKEDELNGVLHASNTLLIPRDKKQQSSFLANAMSS